MRNGRVHPPEHIEGVKETEQHAPLTEMPRTFPLMTSSSGSREIDGRGRVSEQQVFRFRTGPLPPQTQTTQ